MLRAKYFLQMMTSFGDLKEAWDKIECQHCQHKRHRGIHCGPEKKYSTPLWKIIIESYLILSIKKTAVDASAFNCQANFLTKRFKNVFPHVVSDHARYYYMTHCAFIAALI